jgi:hypothetical protein
MIRDAKRLQATRSNPPGQAAISELGGVIGSFLLAVDVDAASLAPAGADNSQGPNPLAPRPRRGTDIRHMTLQQFRYFRDVALAGQLPDSQSNVVSRGQAPLRNRAAELALSTGMHGRGQLRCCPSSASAGPGRASQWSFRCRRAKHGKHHDIFVPAGRWIRWRTSCCWNAPNWSRLRPRPTSPQFRHEHHVQ